MMPLALEDQVWIRCTAGNGGDLGVAMMRAGTMQTGKMRARRATVGLVAMVGGAAMFIAAPAGAQPAPGTTAAANAADKITITQTALAPITTCTTPEQALSYTTFSDNSIFRLRVRASSPLCSPITATAVVYAMPGDGSLWPQTLSQTKSFTISGASQTDIVFSKDCTPAQFDVVTGATPQTISPLGERHGPLLIPDVNTAYQDPGIACSPPTTEVGNSTTVPGGVTTTPTTVANTTVQNTSTTAAPIVAGVSTPTTAPPSVLDTVSNRGGTTYSPAALAVTGVSSQAMGLTGVTLFAVGVGLMLTARHRAVPAVRMITSSWSVDPNSPFGLD